MKTFGPTFVIGVAMALAAAANADPIIAHGVGASGAPQGRDVAGTAGFGAAFRLGTSRGEMMLEAGGSPSSPTPALRQDLGTLKQIKNVHWSFVLSHDADLGFTMSMSGTRNGERTPLTQTLKWSQGYGVSTTLSTVPSFDSGSGSPLDALQLAARATRETVSSRLSFTNMRFESDTLGSAMFGQGVLAASRQEHANLWMTFAEGTDLRDHNWTVTGSVSGFRESGLGGENGVEFDIFGQTMMAVVPLPPAAWAGLSTLAGIGLIGLVRRRRQTAS